MIVSLCNMTGISAAVLPRCLSNFRVVRLVNRDPELLTRITLRHIICLRCISLIHFGNVNTLALKSYIHTVSPNKYSHGFCFAVLCCGYTLTDFPISIRLTSLALWQSNDCPSASKATLMNMDKYFMWIHYERLHNHNKAKHNKTVCIFLGIYCICIVQPRLLVTDC